MNTTAVRQPGAVNEEQIETTLGILGVIERLADSRRPDLILKEEDILSELRGGKEAFRNTMLAVKEHRFGLDDRSYASAFAAYLRVGLRGTTAEQRGILNRRYHRLGAVSQELRAQGFAIDSAGGFLVPESFAASIYEVQKLTSAVRSVAQVVTTETGRDLPWPTVDDTANTGELLAENIEAASQDLVFGQVGVKAFKYSSKMVKVSMEWLEDSGAAVEPTLARLLGQRVARIQNAHFTTGTGTGQPQGVVTGSALGKTGAGAAVVGLDELFDLVASVDPEYRLNARFMMADSTLTAIAKLKETTTNARLVNLDERRLLGYPVSINPSMAVMGASAKSILFGDFSAFIVRDAGDMTLLRLSERFAPEGQVAFLLFQRSDSRLLTNAAIKHFANP